MLGNRKISPYFFAILLSLLAGLYFLSGFWHHAAGTGDMDSLPPNSLFKFEVVPGYFLQSESATDTPTFDYTKHNFGLIDRHYPSQGPDKDLSGVTQWQRFTLFLHSLRLTSPPGTTYKVLYLARHGEGYHNVAEAFYGTEAWNVYWSKLDGNGTMTWSDAHLTSLGQEQARDAGAFLGEQFKGKGTPVPGSWYVSPLMRCLETANLTWSNLELSSDGGEAEFKPTIKENIREVIGEHTCDRRSSRSVIHATVPTWEIENGFAEQDELWRADHRETWDEHDVRTLALLDDVFTHDDADMMSVTAHSGTIASVLRVTGHRKFVLPTGGMMPLFVKATRMSWARALPT